jgi:protein required for attachment to host cells
MKRTRTWVVIADGGHAKVLESQWPDIDLAPVEGMVFSVELPPSHELTSDRPGRDYESHGHARHAIESRSDPHRELKRQFAKQLAHILEAKLAEKRFDKLVIVAPPVTLGDLREALPKSVRAKVTAELAHDLVKTPHSELPRHLKDVLSKGSK